MKNNSPPGVTFSEIIWSWIGAFHGIAAVSYADFNIIQDTDLLMVIGSFGASAIIAVIGSSKVHGLGYLYAIIPVGIGAIIMLVVALIVNNIPKTRKYPEFWL